MTTLHRLLIDFGDVILGRMAGLTAQGARPGDGTWPAIVGLPLVADVGRHSGGIALGPALPAALALVAVAMGMSPRCQGS